MRETVAAGRAPAAHRRRTAETEEEITMGMNVRRSGRISIVPPVLEADPHFKWLVDEGYVDLPGDRARRDVKAVVEEEKVLGSPGAYRRVIAAIETNADGFSGYDELADLRSLVRALRQHHAFTGRITCHTGDDGGATWRLTVIGGEAEIVESVTVWPGDACPCGSDTVPSQG